jgi:hypothetical protein
MIEAFLIKFFAQVSEEVLLDVLAALMKEITLNRKKETFGKAVDKMEAAVAELQTEGGNDEKETQALIDAGRDAVRRLRDK